MRAQEEILRLYEEYADMVFRICFIHLKNRQDSYDATQETFLKLMQNNKPFESSEHAKAWLIKVAGNICKNMLTSFWNKNRTGDDVLLLISQGETNESTNQNEVMEAILNLPEKYKDLVYLHYYEGYSIEEIAKMMGKNPSTLRSRLSRAKSLLKDDLMHVPYVQ